MCHALTTTSLSFPPPFPPLRSMASRKIFTVAGSLVAKSVQKPICGLQTLRPSHPLYARPCCPTITSRCTLQRQMSKCRHVNTPGKYNPPLHLRVSVRASINLPIVLVLLFFVPHTASSTSSEPISYSKMNYTGAINHISLSCSDMIKSRAFYRFY